MTFTRTTDYSVIRSIITHPKVYPNVSDDFSPKREDFVPIEHPGIWYVLVSDGEELLGVFTFIPQNAVCWEVHTCLLPNAWGERAKDAGRGVIQWIWDNTPCLRIVTNVPRYNRLALGFALQSGLKQFGNNSRSYMKKGKLHDQILLGISRASENKICH